MIRESLLFQIRDTLHGVIDKVEERLEQGSVYSHDIKMLRMLASKGFPRAQELLDKRPKVKPKKKFSTLVLETPRQESEAFTDWVRRIWGQYEKYEMVDTPGTISEEFLEDIVARAQVRSSKVERLPTPLALTDAPDEELKPGNSAKSRGRKHARLSLVDAKPAASVQ